MKQSDIDDLMDQVIGLEEALGHVTAVEQNGAHIPIEWREIGGIRIGLDAAGNTVRVEFGEPLDEWVAE